MKVQRRSTGGWIKKANDVGMGAAGLEHDRDLVVLFLAKFCFIDLKPALKARLRIRKRVGECTAKPYIAKCNCISHEIHFILYIRIPDYLHLMLDVNHPWKLMKPYSKCPANHFNLSPLLGIFYS